MNARSKRGNLAIFFCLVMSAAMMIFGTLFQAARLRAAENDLSRAMSAQIRCSLAAFSPEARDFGLFGFGASAVDQSVFSGTLSSGLGNCTPQTELLQPLTDTTVLDGQITRFMKGRLPAVYLELLISRLSGFSQNLPVSGAKGTGGSLQDIVDSLTGDLAGIDLNAAAGSLFGDAIDNLKNKILTDLQTNYRQYAAEILGAESNKSIEQIIGAAPDFFDPASISNLAGNLDQVIGFETIPIYEKFCLMEYSIGQFQPSVNKMMTSGGARDLRTIDGRFFKDLPTTRKFEVEQIITGIDNPDNADLTVRVIVTSLRSLIQLIYILTDEQQMTTLRTTSTALSAAILIATSGTVAIEPNVLTYLLAAGQAIGAGLSDYDSLKAGKAVNIWPGSAKINIGLYYQDYLRIFLLIVPRATLVERISRQLNQILPEPYFTSLRITVGFRGRDYQMTGAYNG